MVGLTRRDAPLLVNSALSGLYQPLFRQPLRNYTSPPDYIPVRLTAESPSRYCALQSDEGRSEN